MSTCSLVICWPMTIFASLGTLLRHLQFDCVSNHETCDYRKGAGTAICINLCSKVYWNLITHVLLYTTPCFPSNYLFSFTFTLPKLYLCMLWSLQFYSMSLIWDLLYFPLPSPVILEWLTYDSLTTSCVQLLHWCWHYGPQSSCCPIASVPLSVFNHFSEIVLLVVSATIPIFLTAVNLKENNLPLSISW